MVIKMYLNNCGIRRIAHILNIPLSTVFYWIKQAGKVVDEMVTNQKIEGDKRRIEILEMDELYTYVKKKRIKQEYGLLSIGTDSKLLRLK
ncbi:IS1 family transposase [Candidatus Bandiella woodruffii]|nr:IS1 family transposase [Candidatus Bandiella woodruffii]